MPELELRTLPVLPLKNSVLFPGLMMPLSVGRSASIAAVEAALGTEDKEIIVVAQKDNSVDLPGAGDTEVVVPRGFENGATNLVGTRLGGEDHGGRGGELSAGVQRLKAGFLNGIGIGEGGLGGVARAAEVPVRHQIGRAHV